MVINDEMAVMAVYDHGAIFCNYIELTAHTNNSDRILFPKESMLMLL